MDMWYSRYGYGGYGFVVMGMAILLFTTALLCLSANCNSASTPPVYIQQHRFSHQSCTNQLLVLLPESGWLLSYVKNCRVAATGSSATTCTINKKVKHVQSKKIIQFIDCLPTDCLCKLATGPSVMTLPGSGKSFDQFRQDDYECREYAYQQIGGKTPQQSSRTSGVESTAIGAGLGAVSGVAIAGGEGAAIGAGVAFSGRANGIKQRHIFRL